MCYPGLEWVAHGIEKLGKESEKLFFLLSPHSLTFPLPFLQEDWTGDYKILKSKHTMQSWM